MWLSVLGSKENHRASSGWGAACCPPRANDLEFTRPAVTFLLFCSSLAFGAGTWSQNDRGLYSGLAGWT